MDIFEKTYHIDPKRENKHNIDKDRCIELNDKEYLDKHNSNINKEEIDQKISSKEKVIDIKSIKKKTKDKK